MDDSPKNPLLGGAEGLSLPGVGPSRPGTTPPAPLQRRGIIFMLNVATWPVVPPSGMDGSSENPPYHNGGVGGCPPAFQCHAMFTTGHPPAPPSKGESDFHAGWRRP